MSQGHEVDTSFFTKAAKFKRVAFALPLLAGTVALSSCGEHDHPRVRTNVGAIDKNPGKFDEDKVDVTGYITQVDRIDDTGWGNASVNFYNLYETPNLTGPFVRVEDKHDSLGRVITRGEGVEIHGILRIDNEDQQSSDTYYPEDLVPNKAFIAVDLISKLSTK